MKCPACSGPGILLGSLGLMKHYRCRDCGWTYGKMSKPKWRKPKVKPPEADCDGFDGQFTKMYGKPFKWSGRK